MHRNQASNRKRPRLTAISCLAAALVALAVAGCGLSSGADPGTKHALINVTSDFGSRTIGTAVDSHVTGNESDMALLARHFRITTTAGGRILRSVNGFRSHHFDVKWLMYENGILAGLSAASMHVHKGDHLWWDLQNWLVAQPKAVVGAYPEPFTNGTDGREAPTLLECGRPDRDACNVVAQALRRAGVKAGDSEIGGENGPNSNTVTVGNRNELKRLIAMLLIQAGPRSGGVFAHFIGNHTLQLENPVGDVVRTLHGSIGLIAAVQNGTQTAPAWIVTGTDAAAVMTAARHLNAAALHNHFAVAIYKGHVISLPVVSG